MVQKGYLGWLENTHILVYYNNMSYRKIDVYSVETMRLIGASVICECNYPSKYCDIYCAWLDTIVGFIWWCTLIFGFMNWTMYSS